MTGRAFLSWWDVAADPIASNALANRSSVMLRTELKATGRRRSVRIIETRCMGICPKKAITAMNATCPGQILRGPRGTTAAAVLAQLLPPSAGHGAQVQADEAGDRLDGPVALENCQRGTGLSGAEQRCEVAINALGMVEREHEDVAAEKG